MKNKIVIFSLYIPGTIPIEALEIQQRIMEYFTPKNCDIIQTIMPKVDHIHGPALTKFVNETDYEIYISLDIDAIPLNKEIIPRLIKEARAGKLIGCTGRNGSRHKYATPICMAFSKKLYEKLGVDFNRGKRKLKPEEIPLEHRDYSKKAGIYGEGWVEIDAGEKLTYKAEELGIPVILLKPTNVEEVMWEWPDGFFLGHGTTFEKDIWHQYETGKGMGRFMKKAEEVEEKIKNES